MASAGSSFDFASDDVLCSFDEVVSHDLSNEKKSVELEKDLQESGIGRELVCVYREEEERPKEEIIDVVEKCMKKYTDSLIQHFEGFNGRLTQLEIQCYKLERSMGEFRADSDRDQGEVNAKLKAVSKQLNEVHRSIQIIRDKQELAETQSELTKLQPPSKESNSPTQSQKSDMSSLSSASEPKQHIINNTFPHQQHYFVNQPIPFYCQQPPSLQPEPHYIQARPQIPDPHVPNPPHYQSFVLANSNYAQPKPQLPDPQHQSLTNANQNYVNQSQAQPAFVYLQARPDPPIPTLVPLQQQSQAPPQAILIRAQTPATPYPTAAFACGAPVQQGYGTVYRSMDSSRVQAYSHPSNIPGMQNQQHLSGSCRVQQVMQVHPYADIIEKATDIGYSREQVVDAVNELVDRGRFVDFVALLDKLQMSSGSWTQ